MIVKSTDTGKTYKVWSEGDKIKLCRIELFRKGWTHTAFSIPYHRFIHQRAGGKYTIIDLEGAYLP